MRFLGALLLLHLREGIVVYLVIKDKAAGDHAAMHRHPPSSFRDAPTGPREAPPMAGSARIWNPFSSCIPGSR